MRATTICALSGTTPSALGFPHPSSPTLSSTPIPLSHTTPRATQAGRWSEQRMGLGLSEWQQLCGGVCDSFGSGVEVGEPPSVQGQGTGCGVGHSLICRHLAVCNSASSP